jgi:hypothetical protein
LALSLLADGYASDRTTDQLSANEVREAREIANRFAQRIQQTKDISPILDELFAGDFLSRHREEIAESIFTDPAHAHTMKIDPNDLRRYYVGLTNLAYLSELYFFSRHASTSDKRFTDSLEEMFPPDVLRVIESDPQVMASVNNSLSEIKTTDQLRSLLETIEKAGALLRQHLISDKAEQTDSYQETLADWSKSRDLMKPALNICLEKCFGLPVGARSIIINVPFFQLTLAKISGRMTILEADPRSN